MRLLLAILTLGATSVPSLMAQTRYSAPIQVGNPLPASPPRPAEGQRVYPINLATAMHLAGVRPIDVQLAAKQVEVGLAQYEKSKAVWLPTVHVGGDYFHHEGSVQNFEGVILRANRTSAMVGAGANLSLSVSDSIFAPLAAKQDLKAREAIARAFGNDVALGVAEAYFAVQQARGEYAGALMIVVEAEELVRKTELLAEGLAPPVEATRARVELARRKQAAATAKARWRNASAELARLLRLDPAVIIEPTEPPALTVPLIDSKYTVDDLIVQALLNRPELEAHRAVVKANLERLRQEKLRPLIPSLLVRSVSTNPSGTLGFGTFGGGAGNRLGNYSPRLDYDAQLVWEFRNLGFGNRANILERKAELDSATLELYRLQDRIASEVVKAFADANAAAERLKEAGPALLEAADSYKKNMAGLSQTRRVGNFLTLIVRPAEAVAAIQALAQANDDYMATVADYNRAQFRLYRAMGYAPQPLVEILPSR